MIRRGFWLAVGVALGVTGYRKASRVVGAVRTAAGAPGPAGAPPRAGGAGRDAAARGFLQDIRDGMAEYWDLHRSGIARTLDNTGRRDLRRR